MKMPKKSRVVRNGLRWCMYWMYRFPGFWWRVETLRLKDFERSTHYPLLLRLRRIAHPLLSSTGTVISSSGAKHTLSADVIDTIVLLEMLGRRRTEYFPNFPSDARARLLRGEVAVDIGAFNGGWGIEMLMRYPGSHALFIEPSDEKARLIRLAVSANMLDKRCRVSESALAPQDGNVRLHDSSEGSWARTTQGVNDGEDNHGHIVKGATLSSLLNGQDAAVIKCNAEGAEYLLPQQVGVLRKFPAFIIMMVHPEYGDPSQLRHDFVELGYDPTVARSHPSRPMWHLSYSRSAMHGE